MYKKSYVEHYVYFLTILCILIVVPQYYIPMISMQIFCCLILFCTNYNAQSSEEFNLLEGYYKLNSNWNIFDVYTWGVMIYFAMRVKTCKFLIHYCVRPFCSHFG